MLTRAELEQQVQLARAQEKEKLQRKLDEEKAGRERAEAEAKALKDKEAAAKAADDERKKAEADAKLPEKERQAKALAELQDALKAQKEETARLVREAEERAKAEVNDVKAKLTATELALTKKTLVEAAKITHLADFVTGASKEEIEASVAALKLKEEQIRKTIEEEARARLAGQLPNPVAPARSQRQEVMSRRDIARLPKAEYEKQRALRLEQARSGQRT